MFDNEETVKAQAEGEESGVNDPEIEETLTTEKERNSPDVENGAGDERAKNPWVRRVLFGLLIFIMIVGAGAGLGAARAIFDRTEYENEVVGTAVADQFVRGIIDMENGNYEIAIERFKYILQIDPGHTGAQEQLTKALLEMGASGDLPTPIPANTQPATPDFRGEEELFNQALAYRNAQDWNNLIMTLDSLRTANPEYKAVEVDGMYYLAYRNRGLYRIQVEGNLEGGIFDLNRAELFGPIDIEASNFRQWSELYLTGVSFWDLDWEQVVFYFGQVAPSAPNLSDSSFFTASARLATAQVNYGAYLVDRARLLFSNRRFCDAYDLYSVAEQYRQLSGNDAEKFQKAGWECFGYPATDTPIPPPTATPEP